MRALILALLVTGCAAGPDFQPVTLPGAHCKASCASDMAACRGSSYTCDRAHAQCTAACRDVDRLSDK